MESSVTSDITWKCRINVTIQQSTIPRGVLARKYQNPETYKPKCHHRR